METMENQSLLLTYEYDGAREGIPAECRVEHTLPDYLPEIRRILRVTARPITTGRYVGEGSTEFSGAVAYTVVYADGEGKPAAVSLNGEYTVSCPRAEGDHPSPIATAEVEGTVCRLSGPRRLSLSSSLRCRIHTPRTLPLQAPEGEGCERLTVPCRTRRTLLAEGGEIAFSDGIAVPGIPPEELHPLFCDGSLLLEDLRVGEGSVRLRGTVRARVAVNDSEGNPTCFAARIPMEREIACEGARPGDIPLPLGRITSLGARLTGDGEGGTRLELDGVAECALRLLRNEPITPTVGLYSPFCPSDVVVTPLSLEALAGASFGNYTVSGSFAAPAGEERASRVLDTDATVLVRKVTREGDHPVVMGDVTVRMILVGAPTEEGVPPCHPAEHTYPFRLSLPITLPEGELRFECHAEAIASHGRIEEGGYAADTELAVSLSAFSTTALPAVTAVVLHPEETYARRGGSVTVVYPGDGDTLWSIAERYHTTPAAVAAANRLPFLGNEEAALSHSLDGVSYLLVEYS